MRPIDQLVALALGDVDDAEREALEGHVLDCPSCAGMVERLLAVDAAAALCLHSGRGRFPVPAALLAALEASGLVTRRYALRPGESVACSVSVDDRYVVTDLFADLSDVRRLDLMRGDQLFVADLPFDPSSDRVSFAEAGALLCTFPTMTFVLRLVARDKGGSRTLGEYTLNHSATT